MESNRIPKIVLYAKLEGTRKVERPKPRWLDDVQANIKIIAIEGWRRKAQSRSEWMDVTREVKVKVLGA
jgi:hypothetical protein